VAFKSDHPVINSQHLIYEAAKAHAYGFDPKLAIAAVTSVPATLMGQEWRIGMVKEGYDADLVVWDRYPLDIGASPVLVLTDGIKTFESLEKQEILKVNSQPRDSKAEFRLPDNVASSFLMINISRIYADESTTVENGEILVLNGTIKCIAQKGLCKMNSIDTLQVIDANGGSVIPVISENAGRSRLGLEEIPSEKITSNGYMNDIPSSLPVPMARDGLRLNYNNSKLIQSVHRAGVLTAIAIPRSEGVFSGTSCAFLTGSSDIRNAVLADNNALHFTVSNSAKTCIILIE
jgi:hypothetical protein